MATDFLAGCVGGVAGVVVGHPLDTVKVRIQTQCSVNPVYRGTLHCLQSILVKEGTRGLYRGLTSPMYGVAAVNALTFGIQGNVRRLMKDPDCLRSQFTAGMIAGGCQAVVVSPMELVKSQLQVQSAVSGMGTQHFSSPWDCCRQLWARSGARGLMRGYWVTVVREVPAFGLYFGTYEMLTTGLVGDQRKSLSHMLFAGGMAGVASWVFTYPIDVVKTRIQTDGMAGIQNYSGYMDCIRSTMQREGWRGFMRGVSSASIRAFPTNAVTLAMVSVILEYTHDRRRAAAEPESEPLLMPHRERHQIGQELGQQQFGQQQFGQQQFGQQQFGAGAQFGQQFGSQFGQPSLTVTQVTVQVETTEDGGSARRRKATIRLDGEMALGQLRGLLDREVAALGGQLGVQAMPVSNQRSGNSGGGSSDTAMAAAAAAVAAAAAAAKASGIRRAVAIDSRSAPSLSLEEEAGSEEEEQLDMADVLPCRHVRRETTVVTHIVEYDVGDNDRMARIVETATA